MCKNTYRLLIWIVLWLPLVTFAAVGGNPNITTTTSTSTGVGPINADFVWSTMSIGPGTIAIGNFGACTIPPGPYPNGNCTLDGGSGTVADPFSFGCSTPLTLSGCTLPGTSFFVAAGTANFNTHTHLQTALAAPAAVATPLGPWAPIASAIAIALLALGWQLRRRRG
jgi:hypothetical protein